MRMKIEENIKSKDALHCEVQFEAGPNSDFKSKELGTFSIPRHSRLLSP